MKHLCEHCPLQPPMKPCRECAKPFRPRTWNGPRAQIYCSQACRHQANARKSLASRPSPEPGNTVTLRETPAL
jgi:hypothetical protein